jgi:hypothetical protein
MFQKKGKTADPWLIETITNANSFSGFEIGVVSKGVRRFSDTLSLGEHTSILMAKTEFTFFRTKPSCFYTKVKKE